MLHTSFFRRVLPWAARNGRKAAEPTVVRIVGTSYCGSSLLSLLLNTQEDICALGEAHNAYLGPKDCFCTCGNKVVQCGFFRSIRPQSFYRDCFERLACGVLVDSSKNRHLLHPAHDPDFRYVTVFLSKSPPGFAHSQRWHEPSSHGSTVAGVLASYISFYEQHLEKYPEEPGARYVLSYEAMMRDPATAVRDICRLCGIGFSEARMESWWKTDSHILGGNSNVHRQVRGFERSYGDDADHEKYVGKFRSLFLDQAWKKDAAFIGECLEVMESQRAGFEALLPRIGQPSYAELMQELRAARDMTGVADDAHSSIQSIP